MRSGGAWQDPALPTIDCNFPDRARLEWFTRQHVHTIFGETMTKFALAAALALSLGAAPAFAAPPTQQELDGFIKQYVDATNSHDFANVRPLLLPGAVYWFNKQDKQGTAVIQAYFEDTWRKLPDEVYGIENVKWLSIDENSATCIYDYTYRGHFNGKAVQGRGRGTTVLVRQGGQWRIAHEHLSIPV